jgi:hypothetical protein
MNMSFVFVVVDEYLAQENRYYFYAAGRNTSCLAACRSEIHFVVAIAVTK